MSENTSYPTFPGRGSPQVRVFRGSLHGIRWCYPTSFPCFPSRGRFPGRFLLRLRQFLKQSRGPLSRRRLRSLGCLALTGDLGGLEVLEVVLAGAVEGPVTSSLPGSAIQLHPHVTVVVDEAAASQLQYADYYRYAFANKPAWQGL